MGEMTLLVNALFICMFIFLPFFILSLVWLLLIIFEINKKK